METGREGERKGDTCRVVIYNMHMTEHVLGNQKE